jgi:hypothetical protein
MIAFKRTVAAVAEIDRRMEVLRSAQRGTHSLGLQECLREELEALAERREDELRWGRRLARLAGLVHAQAPPEWGFFNAFNPGRRARCAD